MTSNVRDSDVTQTMSTRARITMLVENTAGGRGTTGAHGLAMWLETTAGAILFDTGPGDVLLDNARAMDIDLGSADTVVLSHGHYDHTGGLLPALELMGKATVYAAPGALDETFARNADGSSRSISTQGLSAQSIRDRGGTIVWTDGPREITGGIFVTGPVPRQNDFEDTGGPFFLDAACHRADPLCDDQSLFFQSAQGTIVLLGCAHAGIINTLQYVQALTDHRNIHAVIGGTHLRAASDDRLDRTIRSLKAMKIDRLGLAHCTGAAATTALQTALPGQCFPCPTGWTLDLEIS